MRGRDYGIYVDGTWIEPSAGERLPILSPIDGDDLGTLVDSTPGQVRLAVDAACAARDGEWRSMSGSERGRSLLRFADLIEAHASRLAQLETTDNGKVIRETGPQMLFAARQYRFFAGYADKLWGQQIPLDMPDMLDFTRREPYGVVALITPWNSPMSSLSNKLGPALAAGNTVVVKPSEHASLTTLEVARLAEEAGIPPGVFNVITGGGITGQSLVSAKGVAKVSVTGSPATGRHVARAAAERLIPATLELGGKSANIVFADADLDRAVVGALAGIFAATGQTCIAGSRLLVERSIYDSVLSRLIDRASRIRVGDPRDPLTEMGPLANRPQLDRVLTLIQDAVADGAELVLGGKAPDVDELAGGFFLSPTIFAHVTNSMRIAREEVFGPVLSVIPFESEDEAISIANASEYGLAAGVWTEDMRRALRVVQRVEVGTVWVNTYRAMGVQAPFGGVKESGYGRERGEAAIHEYTTLKNVMIDYSTETRDPFALKS